MKARLGGVAELTYRGLVTIAMVIDTLPGIDVRHQKEPHPDSDRCIEEMQFLNKDAGWLPQQDDRLTMDASDAIPLIHQLIDDAEQVRRDKTTFDAWRRKCRTVLSRVFGANSQQSVDLDSVNFRFYGVCHMGDQRPHVQAFESGIEKSKKVLESFIWEIQQFGIPLAASDDDPRRAFKAVQAICLRFHAVVRQLRTRHGGRPTFEVDDEYDVQDLLHALLRLHFDDIRPEEWTPSYAGKSSRMDFLLKKEKTVIEVKKTRKGLDAKQLGEELIIDMAHYRNHPDCNTLICFAYDPENRIANATGLESDLSSDDPDFTVCVIISPKN